MPISKPSGRKTPATRRRPAAKKPPAVKTRAKAVKVEPPAPEELLRTTDVPGVYRNWRGLLVNEHGVSVSFKEVKRADLAQLAEAVSDGNTLPAELLRAWANDPRLSRAERQDCAKAAAPYFSPKLTSVTGAIGVVATTIDYDSMDPATLRIAIEAAKKLLDIQTQASMSVNPQEAAKVKP